MIKCIMAFAALNVSLVLSAPRVSDKAALKTLPAVEHEHIHDKFGQYALRYVTPEGTVVSERGHLIPTADGKSHVIITEGEISYIGDDGKTYVTRFSAGLDGYKPEGAHLPIAPEPVVVQKPVLLSKPVAKGA